MFRCSRQIFDTVISWNNLEIFEKDEGTVCCVCSTFIRMIFRGAWVAQEVGLCLQLGSRS